MLRSFSDHAANERTFLAWVRTGIAIIAFGFVVEKFNLFVAALASSAAPAAGERIWLERLRGPLGRYDGFALILLGTALIVVSGIRFARLARRIDDSTLHALSIRSEVGLSTVLALLAIGICVYLVVQ